MLTRFTDWVTGKSRARRALFEDELEVREIAGVKFYFKKLGANYILDLQKRQVSDPDQMIPVLYEIIASSVCDKSGRPIFEPQELTSLSIYKLNSILAEVLSVNGLNEGAVEDARAALKNMLAQGAQ